MYSSIGICVYLLTIFMLRAPVVRLHRLVFGHLSRELAAAKLKGSPVAAATASARHRDSEAGGDAELDDDDFDDDDYDDDYDDYGVSFEEFGE